MEPSDALHSFRRSVYECLRRRRDALFELADAILAADGAVPSPAHLSLQAPHPNAAGAQPQTPTHHSSDRYIVVFKDSVQRPAAVANEHARENGLQLRFVYTSAIKGYSAVFPNERALQRVKHDPRVAFVEQDQMVRAVDHTATATQTPTVTTSLTAKATDEQTAATGRALLPETGGVLSMLALVAAAAIAGSGLIAFWISRR